MIDLHCHLLPGVDDGPRTLDESLAMARLAVSDGIDVIAATPHLSVDRTLPGLEALVDALARAKVPLRLVAGGELALSPEIPGLLAASQLPTLNHGRYALVELSVEVLPPNLDRLLFELQVAGVIPVLAHVERYRFTQAEPDLLTSWSERGAVLQITAASLRGDFGKRAHRTAELIVKRPLPAIVASDAHDWERRPPALSFARELLTRAAGSERAADLLDRGPAAILDDRPFPTPSPSLVPPPAGWRGMLSLPFRHLRGTDRS